MDSEIVIHNIANKLKEYMNRHIDGNIYISLNTHTDEYLNSNEGKFVVIEHCMRDTRGAYIHELIRDIIINHEDFDGVIRYIHKNTFGSIDLAKTIKRDIIQLVDVDNLNINLMGMLTENDILSNAILLKTVFPNANVNVYIDCCGSLSDLNHETAISAMNNCNIRLIIDEKEDDE